MKTHETRTLTVRIGAAFQEVAQDLANPMTHHLWATRFFAGPPAQADGHELVANVPMMGGRVRYRVDSKPELGIFDLFVAPLDAEFGDPISVRLIRNGDGVDVLWTLARAPGQPDAAWQGGLQAMQLELEGLRHRHEASASESQQ